MKDVFIVDGSTFEAVEQRLYEIKRQIAGPQQQQAIFAQNEQRVEPRLPTKVKFDLDGVEMVEPPAHVGVETVDPTEGYALVRDR